MSLQQPHLRASNNAHKSDTADAKWLASWTCCSWPSPARHRNSSRHFLYICTVYAQARACATPKDVALGCGLRGQINFGILVRLRLQAGIHHQEPKLLQPN